MKEKFIRSLDNIKDTDNLTIILQIFGLQEQPSLSKKPHKYMDTWKFKGGGG